MPTATAVVATDRPERYLKQLVGHFGHNIETFQDGPRGELRFGFGTCQMDASVADVLALTATADDDANLTKLQDVVARHLVRFGGDDHLVVEWPA